MVFRRVRMEGGLSVIGSASATLDLLSHALRTAAIKDQGNAMNAALPMAPALAVINVA